MQKYQRIGTFVLIWAVPSNPMAQIRSARGAAAEGRRRPSSAAVLRGGLPDLAKLGCPGVKSTRIRVWGARRGTRNSPGGSVELDRALDDAGTGGDGSARRCPTACRCWVALGLGFGRNRVRVRVQGQRNPNKDREVLCRAAAMSATTDPR